MAVMAQDLFRPNGLERKLSEWAIRRLHVAAALAIMFAVVLLDAMAHARAGFDLAAIKAIQSLDGPGFDSGFSAISLLTGTEGAIAVWIAAVGFFAVRRIWSAVLAFGLLPIGGMLNTLVGELLVTRTRPHLAELERTSSNFEERSFPSGHVMGAVMFYGLIFIMARRIENRALRLTIQGAAVGIIAATSFGRIWEGAHWPSDVLGALLLGGLLLVAIVEIFDRAVSLDRLPIVRAQRLEHDENETHAHALTSLVLFQGSTVAKIYSPGLLPRAIYWLAFQAPFPYISNVHALWAAAYRRNLAGSLTEYWYGERQVAGVLGVDRIDGRMALVSEYIDGRSPTDRAAAKAFLVGIRARFEEAGLPTWQIDPRQPRAIDNILERSDGKYMIVDLESGLVSPLASPKTWMRALDRQMVPFFDDIFFDVLRGYVDREEAAMSEKLGANWVAELKTSIDEAEAQVAKWHAQEFRLWRRLAGLVNGGFGTQALVAKLQAIMAGGNEKAMAWMDKGVTRWQNENRLTDQEVTYLRKQMAEPDFQQVMPYLGGHILLSIPLRFPFGMIIRPLLVLGALGVSTVHLARRRITKAEWKRAFGIHSPLVMFFAAMPGIGSLAYLASNPIRSNRLMMRVVADAALFKIPKGLYLKSGARKWIARSPFPSDGARTEQAAVGTTRGVAGQPTTTDLDAVAA